MNHAESVAYRETPSSQGAEAPAMKAIDESLKHVPRASDPGSGSGVYQRRRSAWTWGAGEHVEHTNSSRSRSNPVSES